MQTSTATTLDYLFSAPDLQRSFLAELNMGRCLATAVFAIGALALNGAPLRGQGPVAGAHTSAARDSAAALAVFRENIDAIHKRDHPRYLRTYLQTPGLTLGGLRGMNRTWMAWPARSDSAPAWPDTLIVNEMRVAPLAPGVVYGMYRYRGVVQGKASVGISERVFVKTAGGWKISYTASFPDTLPP